jgi:hypothetical protein
MEHDAMMMSSLSYSSLQRWPKYNTDFPHTCTELGENSVAHDISADIDCVTKHNQIPLSATVGRFHVGTDLHYSLGYNRKKTYE